MAHTRGPWKRVGDSIESVTNTSRAHVCYLGDSSRIADERDANARLIAAAPEMWEALRDMVERATFDGVRWTIHSSIDGVIHRARAALAKAEGR